MKHWPLITGIALPLLALAQTGPVLDDTQNAGAFDGSTGIYQTCVIAEGIGSGLWNVQLQGRDAPALGADMFSLQLIAATEAEFDTCGTTFDPDSGEFTGLVTTTNAGEGFDQRTFLFQATLDPDAPGFEFTTNLSDDFIDITPTDDNNEAPAREVVVTMADRGSFNNQLLYFAQDAQPAQIELSAPLCQASIVQGDASVQLPVALDLNSAGVSLQQTGSTVSVASGSLAAGSYGISARCVAMLGEDSFSSAPANVSIFIIEPVPIGPVNAAPFLTTDTVTVNEDSGPYSGTVASPGADEASQNLTVTVTGNSNTALFADGPAIDGDGSLSFTPADDAYGEAELTLELRDDGGTAFGGVDTSTTTLTIDVRPVNDAPVISATLAAVGFPTSTTVTSPRSADPDFDLLGPDSARTVTYGGLIEAVSAGPQEGAQTVTVTIVDVDNALNSEAIIDDNGDVTLDFSDAIADGPILIEIHATDDGGTDNGGTATAVLPLRIIPSEPSTVESRFARGIENQRCVAISLREETFKDIRNPDNILPGRLFVIETVPAQGTLFTADLTTEITAGESFDSREFCFVPDEYTSSEPGELYASFTYSVIDDFGIRSSNTGVVEIEIEGVFD